MDVLDAYHEAAHAIMAVRLNRRFENVILCRIREGNRTVTGRVVFPKEPHGLGQFVYAEDAYAEALIFVAGGIANKIIRPHRTYKAIYGNEALKDYASVRDMVSFHMFDQPMYERLSLVRRDQCESYIGRVVFPHARKLLKSDWAAVVQVGETLLEKRTLSYDEVKAMVPQACTIPTTPYDIVPEKPKKPESSW
jgi:hypothetical protein